jgi:hypothetical protein
VGPSTGGRPHTSAGGLGRFAVPFHLASPVTNMSAGRTAHKGIRLSVLCDLLAANHYCRGRCSQRLERAGPLTRPPRTSAALAGLQGALRSGPPSARRLFPTGIAHPAEATRAPFATSREGGRPYSGRAAAPEDIAMTERRGSDKGDYDRLSARHSQHVPRSAFLKRVSGLAARVGARLHRYAPHHAPHIQA